MFMLDEIVAHKRVELERKKREASAARLRDKLAAARAPRDFRGALKAPGISLIAEIKRKSPSKGEFRAKFEPEQLARAYEAGGASAISVLADEAFFGNGASVVEQVANLGGLSLPVMYKDFIVDEYQILEARAVGADAALVIVRSVPDDRQLAELLALAGELGMGVIAECFTPADAERALGAGAKIVGINNRDLQTFEVDIRRAGQIRALLGGDIVTVSESGMHSRSDALQAQSDGFDAMLVGEAILSAADPGEAVRRFVGREAEGGAAEEAAAGKEGVAG
ncbi:indole-3-glycerol phosphate synthase TrpC [Paenibacillus sp. B01]|uniref:indole-3-glycerol phosphate synthase TrpC n=1 Tax=Paenibacillus sp. B01 TaxID=2660554 RepID=UPI00129B2EAA|nr:indole-3-glycerol phosphate synthase TrpC [Paenibacillus sp. B01]QGG55156.1 indole-3-glycerol phosphate synthase TrpC [Paenibacillus sp. B01]